jgi:[protein-PII] uridylyltransferase
VTSARIETLGADAVDCFYVCNPSGSPVGPDQRSRVDAALVEATRGRVPEPEGRAPVHIGRPRTATDTPG